MVVSSLGPILLEDGVWINDNIKPARYWAGPLTLKAQGVLIALLFILSRPTPHAFWQPLQLHSHASPGIHSYTRKQADTLKASGSISDSWEPWTRNRWRQEDPEVIDLPVPREPVIIDEDKGHQKDSRRNLINQ